MLDVEYPKQVKKYSEQLIELYEKNGELKEYRRELLFQLENFNQEYLKYFLALKEIIGLGKDFENSKR